MTATGLRSVFTALTDDYNLYTMRPILDTSIWSLRCTRPNAQVNRSAVDLAHGMHGGVRH